MSINNVVAINQKPSVHEDILTFLADHEEFSVNTRKNYERSIKMFFKFIKNKEIKYLTVEDLDVRNTDMKKFRVHLRKDRGYANVTVNSCMSAVTSLYEHLEKNRYNVNSLELKLRPLPSNGRKWGKLFINEAEEMAKLARNQVKGHEKSTLIRLAYTTSFRRETLLSLTWNDIIFLSDKNIYEVRVMTKGQKFHKRPISVDLYNELLKIKEQKYYQRYNDNKIFHLSDGALQFMMDTLKKELGIEEERYVVFHSFRNVLANYIKETEANPYKIKKQLGHSNLNTSMNYIDEDNEDYLLSPGIQIENKINDDVFDDLSRDELLELVKSFGNGIGMSLKMKAKQIVDAR